MMFIKELDRFPPFSLSFDSREFLFTLLEFLLFVLIWLSL